MALQIETFSNKIGGFSFFKAIGHPAVSQKTASLIENLTAAGRVAVYDPFGNVAAFAELHCLDSVNITGVYGQDIESLGTSVLGQTVRPVTALENADAAFIVDFDIEKLVSGIRHLLPAGTPVYSLDDARLDDDMITVSSRYIDPLNFATNFAFFRDAGGQHTRIVTANYWAGYGGQNVRIWCCLLDEGGRRLAEWFEELAPGVGTVTIDSQMVRDRFELDEFTGQLFLHVVNGAGHDVVKYALDTYGDEPSDLSCTHDANAWPADLYAGLPAPGDGEDVILWVQNSHPCPIPSDGVGLNVMGDDHIAWLKDAVPPFGTKALSVSEILPDARWPAQVEIRAGKHFVRPRYEVVSKNGRRRISHPNVERTDLTPDPNIHKLPNLMGKGFILPAPILPTGRFRSIVLPTPMSTAQTELPVAAIVYDPNGREVGRHSFGALPRDHTQALQLDDHTGGLGSDYGHVELVYEDDAGVADGWLHGLFRYEDRETGHGADTSFGAHIFNTVLTYKNEPQSYSGRAPGLSTRLFLRVGSPPFDTMCHLIYCASTPWHDVSTTELQLCDATGREIAIERVAIPCGGSLHWRFSEMFDEKARNEAGNAPYVVIRDTTCRLFGYHGLVRGSISFSLDHMFGF